MNFGKSFTFMFEDPHWSNKLIVPLLVGLIPIIGPMVQNGYLQRTIKNVAAHESFPLPELDFGPDLERGFRFFLISLLYALPWVLISLLLSFPASTLDRTPSGAIANVAVVLIAVFVVLGFIIVAMLQPIMLANVAVKETFAAGFAFKDFTRMLQNNPVPWLFALLGMIISVIISPLGLVFFVVGGLVTGFYGQLMVAHLSGQAYNLSKP